MIKNVTFNKGGKGAKSGRIILPAAYLEIMNITEDEPGVEVTYKDGKIIIEKTK
ncbi:AbrB/MazE/SpoVT family DNA-binding domain-containing protein [Clostridium neonatale]|uniref:AbrB/MazE/SpoVT family DNA-binding domain-containing protein n=1 Tax=Clostridium neonatale TaxID=137838 RepID=UPI00291B613A|nr:AbrB/MazE/SpoVT family DNA-binding domain-containing protein [Clostridium neonatale]CAI3193048.1 PemI [Clostridium neonatale]CAI3197051.1 PemI [Clostridium neonatale]